jgi:hypothetical protein
VELHVYLDQSLGRMRPRLGMRRGSSRSLLSIRNRPFTLAYAVVRSVGATSHNPCTGASVAVTHVIVPSSSSRRCNLVVLQSRQQDFTEDGVPSHKKLGSAQFNYAGVVSSIQGPTLGLAALPSLGLGAQKSSMRRHGDIQRMDFRVRSHT